MSRMLRHSPLNFALTLREIIDIIYSRTSYLPGFVHHRSRPFFPLLLVTLALTGIAPAEEVYFLRGGFDIFSTGMNQMAAKLRKEGINAKAASFAGWKGIADDIIRRSKTGSVSYPIIVLGHSFGGDAGPDFANYLGKHRIPVALVVGFDALSSKTLRGGADRVINFRTTSGGRYQAAQGFRGRIREVLVADSGANHFNIEENRALQNQALEAIRAEIRKRP